MTKQELLNELTKSGEVSVFRATPTWRMAFDKHNSETKKHKSPHCGSCFKDILEWLKQG